MILIMNGIRGFFLLKNGRGNIMQKTTRFRWSTLILIILFFSALYFLDESSYRELRIDALENIQEAQTRTKFVLGGNNSIIKYSLLDGTSVELDEDVFSRKPRKHIESWYQNLWCEKRFGSTEIVMPDNSRCDCVINDQDSKLNYAIEFDFANKWAEAIGQSLLYSFHTGYKPGIVLILEQESDYAYYLRLTNVVTSFMLPINIWTILNYSDDESIIGIMDDFTMRGIKAKQQEEEVIIE